MVMVNIHIFSMKQKYKVQYGYTIDVYIRDNNLYGKIAIINKTNTNNTNKGKHE